MSVGKTKLLAVRLAEEAVARIDAIADATELLPDARTTRTDVLRAAVALGLPLLEERRKQARRRKA